MLPEVGSGPYFDLLALWVETCNKAHQCVPQSDGPLPTRVLDIESVRDSNSLRLFCPSRNERGKYIALSHCWGKLEEIQKKFFCTYECNINKRCKSIDYGSLPKSFQDAVIITRALGIRFLWIDSMCIIQPHKGCSNKCGQSKDWETESKKMESYFGSAYCTIAATSAKDSNQGFLHPRAGKCAKVPNATGGPLYVLEDSDDFRRDVEEGALNQRAWVYQERALSRRTIHFTKTQTYWECGHGILCEDFIRMRNPRANIFADPDFPKSFLKCDKNLGFRLFQMVFTEYSKLALSFSSDKSIAISGLEQRISRTLNTGVKYGVFGYFPHRSLLWQRSGDTMMSRIRHSTVVELPSWSWMAYDGEISYMDIPSGQVEWSNAVRSDIASELNGGDGDLQQPDDASDIALNVLVRQFSLSEDERRSLIFDEDDREDIRRLRCVIIGREEWVGRDPFHRRPHDDQKFYVLVIKQLSGIRNVYKRVGVGRIESRHICFDEPASWGWIF
jgi:hypothetical protein